MIFSSFNGTGLLESLGIGSKSFKQRFTDRIDKRFFEDINEYIVNGNTGKSGLNYVLNSMGDDFNKASDSAQKFAKNAILTGKQIDSVGTSAKKSSVFVKVLAGALNVAVTGLISFGLTKLLEHFDNVTHKFDSLRDKLQEASNEYAESEREIKNIESELTTIKSRIEELNSLDSLTFVEQQELQKLQDAADAAERTATAMGYIAEHKGKETNLAFASLIDSVTSDQYYASKDTLPAASRTTLYSSNFSVADENAMKASYAEAMKYALEDSLFGSDGTHGAVAEWVNNAYSNAVTFLRDELYEDVAWTRENEAYAALEFYKLAKKDVAEINSKIAKEELGDSPDAQKLEDYQQQKRFIEEAATSFFNIASNLYKEMYVASTQPGVTRTAENEDAFKVMDALNLAIQNAQLLVGDMTQGEAFKSLLSSDNHKSVVDELNKLAEKGELSVDTIPVNVDTSEFIKDCELIGVTAEQVVNYINTQFDRIKDPKPQLPDLSTTLSSLYKNTEQYTTLTDAIEEQASAGKISVETMKALTDISPDFINYLEKTADGYAINTDALMEYIEAQDLMEKTKAINAIHDLNEELKDADITSDRRDQILAEIQKWEMLVYEIENATGALAKYKAASETENQDADFAAGKSIYELIKENRKIGKTGTDDFQAGVEFLLGEGWEKRYANDLKAAYKDAEEIGKKFFGQETESDNYKEFFNYLAKNTDFARFNELGQVVFDNVDLAAIAEEVGMSVDAVRSLFQLAEAYGNKIEYDFEVDTTELEYAEAVINELEERRKSAQTELNKTKVGTEAYNRLSSQINELDKMIDIATIHEADMKSDTPLTIDGAIEKFAELNQYSKYLAQHGFEVPVSVTGDMNAFSSFLNNFKLLKDDEGNTVGYKVEVKNAEEATKLIEDLKSQVEEVQNNTDISDTMKATLTEQMQTTINTIQSYIDGGAAEAFTFKLAIDQNSAKIVDTLIEKNPDAITLTVEVEPTAYKIASDKINDLVKDHTVKIVPEVEDTNNVMSTIPNVVAGEKLGYTSMYENGVEEYHGSVTDKRLANIMVAGTDNLAVKGEDGSYFAENIQSYFERIADEMYQLNGKVPSVDQLTTAYEGALERGEITVANLKPDKLKEYAENGRNGVFAKNNLIPNSLTDKATSEIALDADMSKAEEKRAEFVEDTENTEVAMGIATFDSPSDTMSYLEESADYILSVADACGTAQSNQDAMKQSAEELKAAFNNLNLTDPDNITQWHAASLQFNSAVENYQSAYNTLASELEELAPAEVKANISSAKKSIDSLNGRTISINVKANNTSTSVSSSSGGLLNTFKGWLSGSSNASGTKQAKKGMSLVDEEGPELIEHVSEGTYELGTNKGPRFTKLNEGDIVHTATETKKILSRMGGTLGGFFRDGLNNTKAIVGKSFSLGTTISSFIQDKIFKPVKDVVQTITGAASSGASIAKDLASGVVDTKGSGTKKSSSSGSSGSSKNGKLDDYLSKLFDWIEVRLTRLQQSTDGWLAQVAEAVGYVAKNAKLDNALTSVAKQIDASTKAYSRYMQQAQEIADKFNLDPELIRLVQEGEIDIASYDEDTQKKIQAYQEW